MSSALYKCYPSHLLDSIVKSSLGAAIRNFMISIPTCAEDTALLASSVAQCLM